MHTKIYIKIVREKKSKKWKRKKLMNLIRSKSFDFENENVHCSENLYLGNRAEPGTGSSASLNNNNRSSVGKLSIRRRRKNHSRSSTNVE